MVIDVGTTRQSIHFERTLLKPAILRRCRTHILLKQPLRTAYSMNFPSQLQKTRSSNAFVYKIMKHIFCLPQRVYIAYTAFDS